MLYRVFGDRYGEHSTETRILEIHQGVHGWYFTVRRNDLLLYRSPEQTDRVKVTTEGIRYFDNLTRMYLEAREQERGQTCGQ
jgi:hypothetical protein